MHPINEEGATGPWHVDVGSLVLWQIASFDTQTDFLLTRPVICGQLVVAVQPPGL